MPKKNQPYVYGPTDNPLTVAQQNGISTQDLFNANPGGFPFSVGQQINIPVANPYQYSAPIGPQPPTLLQQRMAQPFQDPNAMRGRGFNPVFEDNSQHNPNQPYMVTGQGSNVENFAMRGRGYGQPTAVDNINAMRSRGAGVTNTLPPETAYWVDPAGAGPTGNPNNGYGGFEPIRGGDNTDFANMAAARYNAANNIPFLQQSRWDPRRRRYISVGQWLRQNRRGGRGRGGGKKPPQQKQQEFTLSNSFIDFNAAAG